MKLFTAESLSKFYQSKKQYHIYSFSLFCENQIYSYEALPMEKRLTLYNVIIFIKLVLNKDKNYYYYKIFTEKCSYQLAKK